MLFLQFTPSSQTSLRSGQMQTSRYADALSSLLKVCRRKTEPDFEKGFSAVFALDTYMGKDAKDENARSVVDKQWMRVSKVKIMLDINKIHANNVKAGRGS